MISGLWDEFAGRAAAAGQAGAFEQVVGELDVRADAFHRGGAERVVDRLRQRLGRRRGPRAERERERGGRHADGDDQTAQQQQAVEGKTAEDVHGVQSGSLDDLSNSRLALKLRGS